jgi:hypothetical protein
MIQSRYLFLCALIVAVVTFLLNEWTAEPPAVEPVSVPAGEYSGERAYALLSEILADRVPHPVGTDANKRVRSRIEDYLARNGIDYRVQRGWGCTSDRRRCAWTEDIVATIPGERDGPYVALMAHYDSVPAAPGAGDDGSGIVTVLESARILKGEGPRRNPLMLILTDAEEMGLAGADAFFRANPLAREVGAILNLDGAGTTGPSVVLRTSGDNSTLISLYHDQARFPSASSLTDEVFKRMPNDTDFSVSRRAHVPGIDFVFAGEFTHYHTPNDNLDNLDKRTLQHDGENVLPTARALLEMDLTRLRGGDSRVYLQSPGSIWLDWPAWANGWWLGITALALVAVLYRERLLGDGWRQPVIVFGGPLLVLAAAGAVGFGAFKLVASINGTMPGWPATLWPYRVLLFAAPALGALAVGWGIYRKVGVSLALAGAWCWWWFLGLAATVAMPGAAGVFLAPLMAAAVLLLAAGVVKRPAARAALLAGTLVVAVSQTLNAALSLEETQGYSIIFVTFPFTALFLSVSVPMARGRSAAAGTAGALLLALVGIVGATTAPLYSSWRPQHVNIRYVENVDEGTARVTLDSPNTLPGFMLDELDFAGGGEQAIYPWTDVKVDHVATVPPSGWRAPEATVVASTVENGVRIVDLVLQLERPALSMAMVLPAAAAVRQFTLDDVELDAAEAGGSYIIQMTGMNDRPVMLQIRMQSEEPVDAWLFDSSTELPESLQPLLDARPPLASPAHRGDSALLVRSVQL